MTKTEKYFILINKINGNAYCEDGFGPYEVDDATEATPFASEIMAQKAANFMKTENPSEPIVVAEIEVTTTWKITPLR